MAEPKITVDFRSLKQISRQSQSAEHIPGSLVTWAPVHLWVWVTPRRTVCPSVTRGWDVIHSSGVNTWRDQLRPTQLLKNVARFKGFPPPVLSEDGSRIRYGGREYSLDEFGKHVVSWLQSLTTSFYCWFALGRVSGRAVP